MSDPISLLRELVDALPKCQHCHTQPATHGTLSHQPTHCFVHAMPDGWDKPCDWADAIEKAAVALAAPAVPITDEELHVMRHAIGADKIDAKAKRCRKPQNRRATLEAGYRDPWRNHYCDEGNPAWERLVAVGLATKRAGSELTGGDTIYSVNAVGRERLLDLAKARLLGGTK